MNDHIKEIHSGVTTAFIDANYQSNLAYKPEFISNDHTKGQKVLASIEEELKRCDEFVFSVAFITKGGITPLLQAQKERPMACKEGSQDGIGRSRYRGAFFLFTGR